ncbi:MT-A70 family methyltransferase [Acaryochloris sp. CCMEE 5410]|uniref:MT-A70 family methyltransferase n=1 Tax=Acaryochloris sp. CCMEE 5410 TaxID=310037 RepID=UPI0002483F83|nr:MT-A70 family methyltransferase [Acaryochloris sp. CCMEE 5410]KAI9129549.1 DNA methyltransferase [Acaryochloris sp. CCMEE 5410]
MKTMYAPTDKRGQQKLAITLNLVPNTPPLPVGAFSLIVADPPWLYHLRESEKKHRGRCPYPAMTDEEILAMPVSSIAAPDSYLLLWTTNNHLPVAFRVMEAWGFEYKAIHTWVKTTLDRSKIRFGVGHYGRNATEHVLIGRKGKAKTFMALGLTNIPTAFQAPLGQHSQKPEEFYQMADRLGDALGGQRIELFARCPRPGWESWGAEVEA